MSWPIRTSLVKSLKCYWFMGFSGDFVMGLWGFVGSSAGCSHFETTKTFRAPCAREKAGKLSLAIIGFNLSKGRAKRKPCQAGQLKWTEPYI